MVIVIGGEKGGTGKSTILSNIVVARAMSGKQVLIVDTDPQCSITGWAAIREESDIKPSISCIALRVNKGNVDEFTKKIESLAQKYDDIFIDTGGRDSVELRISMVLADMMLSPTQASQYDLWSLETLDNLTERAIKSNPKLKAYAVINRAPTNPSIKEIQEAKEVIQTFNIIKVLDISIKDRISHRKSIREGLSIAEYKPLDIKAKSEIIALYQELFIND